MTKSTFENKEYRENLGFVLLFLVTFFVLQLLIGNAYIPSGSMEPTLTTGKSYMYLGCSYWFSDPKRGDIIVFDDHGTVYCKRIIALPGETLDLFDGQVYIDGQLLDEPYANGETYEGLNHLSHYEVPEGKYFFMGDNRLRSKDARSWDYEPFITKSQILGRIIKKN